MQRTIATLLTLLISLTFCGFGGVSPPDPFWLSDNFAGSNSVRTPNSGATPRSPAITGSTLVLIGAGQSNCSNVNPTLYLPSNSGTVDHFNTYDGAIYNINGPLTGTSYLQTTGLGPGNVLVRVADSLANATFTRVIIADACIGSSLMADWATGVLSTRIPALMARLKSRGITPSTPNLTVALLLMIGESDNSAGTTQSAFAASATTFINTVNAQGFTVRFFVTQETWTNSTTSTPVRSAQAGLWNGTTIFSAGDLDVYGASFRVNGAAGVHFNDSGASNAASTIVTNMHNSGAPF